MCPAFWWMCAGWRWESSAPWRSVSRNLVSSQFLADADCRVLSCTAILWLAKWLQRKYSTLCRPVETKIQCLSHTGSIYLLLFSVYLQAPFSSLHIFEDHDFLPLYWHVVVGICRWDKNPLWNRKTVSLPLVGRTAETWRRMNMLVTHVLMGFGKDQRPVN